MSSRPFNYSVIHVSWVNIIVHLLLSVILLARLLALIFCTWTSGNQAAPLTGIQLGYTLIFGWYAAFLFVRTGNFISPVVAHIFCNMMGLPTWSRSESQVIVGASFALGILCFLYLLFPMTDPVVYNDRTGDCRCWQGYCSWG